MDPHAFTVHSSTPASTVYPISSFLSYTAFSSNHLAFLTTVNSIDDPTSFKSAVQHSHWHDAMYSELDVLEQNWTWTLVSLPLGKRPVGCKWI